MIELRQLTQEELHRLSTATAEDMQRQQTALLDLQETEGWKVFEVMMRQMERQAFDRMIAAKDAHEMAHCRGAYKALSDMRSWPHRQCVVLGNAIAVESADPSQNGD